MITRSRVAAGALLVFGLAGAREAHRLAIGDASRPGPGFFPFWLAVALCAVGIALVFQPDPGREQVASAPAPLRRGKVILTLLGGLGYALVVEPLGFTATTFVFLLFLLLVIESHQWIASLVISAVTAAASYVLFKVWLAVQLPVGPWGF